VSSPLLGFGFVKPKRSTACPGCREDRSIEIRKARRTAEIVQKTTHRMSPWEHDGMLREWTSPPPCAIPYP
ncbi:MAG: hypothetical protein RMJ19_01450, partial [Gemmatales bacterium]|nr:hypothetical protein [Gemmatales bacterium]MDW8174311.1 hypothetical protein [Gemmatales bacterium]